MTSRLVRLGSALLLLALALLGQPAAAQGSPTEIVGRLNAVLLEVMKNAEILGYRGRLERLRPVLEDAFNYPLMARIAVGEHWRALDEGQKRTLVQEFTRLSSATFASRFDGYSGEHFEVVGTKEQPRSTVLVENRLVKRDGEAVSINYLLRRFNDRWRIIDVYLDAKFSELAIKRSEFTSVVARDGFDGLIASIRTKIDDMAVSAGG